MTSWSRILNSGINLITDNVAKYVRVCDDFIPTSHAKTTEIKGLKLAPILTEDVVQFSKPKKFISFDIEELENTQEVKNALATLKSQPYNPENNSIVLQINNSDYKKASVTLKADGSQVITYCNEGQIPTKLIRKTYDVTGKETQVLIIRPTENRTFDINELIDFEIIESRNGTPLQHIGTVENTPFGKCVKRNFTSLQGTKTEYTLIPQKNGSSLTYKITDKDGRILMDEHRITEHLSDNRTRTILKDSIYETEFTENSIIVKKLDKDGKLIGTQTLDMGGEDYNPNFWETWWTVPENIVGNYKLDKNLANIYQELQGDVLYKLAENGTRIRHGKPIQLEGCFIDYLNTIFLGNKVKHPFVLLHEAGHSFDHNIGKILNKNPNLAEIFENSKNLYMSKTNEASHIGVNYILCESEATAEGIAILKGEQHSHSPVTSLRSIVFQMELPEFIAKLNTLI